MKFLYNKPIFKARRKSLRHNQTDAEKLLWMRLRNKQILGNKFFRQYSIGPYIVDFYCPRKRLVLEIDGSQHTEKDLRRYDLERSNFLYSQDIKLIRFWNNDVIKNVERVLERIVENLS